MASAFDTLFEAHGAPVLEEHLGDTVTYTTGAGASTSITALVGRIEVVEIEDEHGRTQQRQRNVTMRVSVVAAPALNDSLTIDGETWHIEEIVSASGVNTEVRCVSRGSIEHSRPGYRTRR